MTRFKALIAKEHNLVKAALLKDNQLVILDADVLNRPGQLDAIYRARVVKKEVSIYWCDIGLKRPALLPQEKELPILNEGDFILAQVDREAFDDKAESALNDYQKPVKLTRNLVLSHQACLYFPIQDRFQERSTSPILPLSDQRSFLKHLYQEILTKIPTGIGVVYAAPSILGRFLRELPPFTNILVEQAELAIKVRELCQQFRPDLLDRISIYHDDLFAVEGIDEVWQSCLDSVIPFSHGKIIIETTSSLTSIDVNGQIGQATEVNQKAVEIIAQQLTWRRLSGNVVVDFMADGVKEKQALLKRLTTLLAADRPKWKVLGWSPLGWCELQRSKRRVPLETVINRYQNVSE